MSTLSYSLTDLSPEHQPPHQHLRYVTSSSDWNGVLHSHDCTELFYVTDGEGWLCTDETQIPLRKNNLVIVNPKVHHTERSSPEKKMHYIVLGIGNLQFCFHEGETFSPFQIFQLSSHREMILSLLHAILEELQKKYAGTLIGDYICFFMEKNRNTVEDKALYYGLQALLETRHSS